MRGPFTRGILASVHGKVDLAQQELYDLYQAFYEKAPFVHVAADEPDLKSVTNSNFCYIGLRKHGDYVHVVSVIDNLLKAPLDRRSKI